MSAVNEICEVIPPLSDESPVLVDDDFLEELEAFVHAHAVQPNLLFQE